MALFFVLAAMMAMASGQLIPLINKPPGGSDGQEVTPTPAIDATYWLTMSSKVRPGIPFQISAQLLRGQNPVEVTVTFMDQEGVEILLEPPPFTITPGDIQTFKIDIPFDVQPPDDLKGRIWYHPQYQVKVEGKGQDVNFKHMERVQFDQKAFSTFIQTDKGMYKPGQKVMFRILTVYPDMRAVRDEPYQIFIEDAHGNRIRQWLDVKDPNGRGVVELSLQLADEIPTGDWTILATIMGRKETKTFTVDDYVLPRFEVEVDLPPFALSYDPLLKIMVKATYTFGQPVTDGVAKIAISRQWSRPTDEPLYKKGKLSKDGTLTIEVSNKEILKMVSKNRDYIDNLSWQKIIVEAEVTERQTGRTENSSSSVQFFDTPMTLRFVDEVAPKNFKPGLPYIVYTEVRKQDGTRFPEDVAKDMTIYFNVTYEIPLTKEEIEEQREQMEREQEKASSAATSSGGDAAGRAVPELAIARPPYYQPTTKTEMIPLSYDQRVQKVPANGWLTLSFDTPENATHVTIRAWSGKPYKEISVNKWLSPANSPSDSFMQLHVGTVKPKVGTEFKVQAKSTGPMTQLTYQIYAKGALHQSIMLERDPDELNEQTLMTWDFSFMVTRDMTPSITLVAFYVRDENHEVVVDALSLSVDGLFQNPMTVEFSQQEAEPGDKVEVIVKAATDSLVYLLSADKSAILLKGGNDITQDDVREEMAQYTLGQGFSHWEFMFICGWPSPFGGGDASSVLRNAGVIFLSDVLVYTNSLGGYYGKYPTPEIADGGASDMASTAGGSESGRQPFTAAEIVRKFFPEVWLWEISYITDDSGGQVSIPATVPDTLTTWITTGFSLHPELGLSITENPTELVVSRPMFVTLDLPMDIIRGENFCFTATVFSYYDETITIKVTLDRSDKFSNLHVGVDENGKIKLASETKYYHQLLGDVVKGEMRSVKFCFIPTEIGEIPIKVSALTRVQGLSDAVERIIVCKPEGVPRAKSVASIADLSVNGEWSTTVPVNFPVEAVEGSEKLEVSASGNVLASVFDNLDELMKRPYGCGEQNMLNFAPNIFLLEFYMSTDTLTPELKRTAVDYMIEGYQKENRYQHRDGGFSAFGPGDSNASTWLTAFVVKCYALAQQLYIRDNTLLAIDSEITGAALKFLSSVQNRNGGFREDGKVFHKEMQGASAKEGVSLTAYTLIAMHEAQQVFQQGNDSFSQALVDQIGRSMTRAMRYLERQMPTLTDSYDICVTAYALTLVNSPVKDTAASNMERAAKVNGNAKYWERPMAAAQKERYPWSLTTTSINIEMTAYALLVYSLRPDPVSNGLPVIRWLTSNKGPNAGFYSTQDTILGLQALSRVGAELYTGEDIPMFVTVAFTDASLTNQNHVFTLDKSNELLLQIKRIDYDYMSKAPKALNITARTQSGENGPTNAVVEVTFRYNAVEKVRTDKYNLDHTMTESDSGFLFDIQLSAPENRSMTILKIEIPPGYATDNERVKASNPISRKEIKENFFYCYFDTDVIGPDVTHIRAAFSGSGSGTLTKPKERYITVYDFYEPDEEVSVTYTLTQVDENGFCDRVGDVGPCVVLLNDVGMN